MTMTKAQERVANPPTAVNASPAHHDAADFHAESKDYLAKRSLKKGSAGWGLLVAMGVGAVVAGDYAGWNHGLGVGGFGGLAVAAVVVTFMYLALAYGLAELSAALPAAGGGYTFARAALGPWGGYATGVAVLIEYVLAPAAGASFTGAYVESLGLFGIKDGWWVAVCLYVVFLSVHLLGAGEALKLMFVFAGLSVLGLVIFAFAAIGDFEVGNLFDIAATDAAGASEFLPFGLAGIWAALPFAIWFFLAVEAVPLAAEEAKNPQRDVPRGIVGAMLVLIGLGVIVLMLVTGAMGAAAASTNDNPVVEALAPGLPTTIVNYLGLVGMIGSFFCCMFGFSRQTFALSRAGYLPTSLSIVNGRKAPTLALLVPGGLSLVLCLSMDGAVLLDMAVFVACLSYILMMVSHIVLRLRDPHLPRPYRTPGGVWTTGFAAVIAAVALVATIVNKPVEVAAVCLALAAFAAHFALYSRHRLVANSPDEEFAMLAESAKDLK
jgi:ethanolamine permease